MPSAPGPGQRSGLVTSSALALAGSDASVNMEMPMVAVEQNVRALRAWQAEGENLLLDMTQ